MELEEIEEFMRHMDMEDRLLRDQEFVERACKLAKKKGILISDAMEELGYVHEEEIFDD